MNRRLVLLIGVFACCQVAHADRMPIPEATLCNKSKVKAHVATATFDTYTGWSSEGWRLVKPGECYKFKADAFHARGKRRVKGAGKRIQKACVLDSKVFRFTAKDADGEGIAKQCAARKGRIVEFKTVPAGKKPPPMQITR